MLYIKLWLIFWGGLLLGTITFLATFLMKDDFAFAITIGLLMCLCSWTVACVIGWILDEAENK
jgi:hypothetical protein